MSIRKSKMIKAATPLSIGKTSGNASTHGVIIPASPNGGVKPHARHLRSPRVERSYGDAEGGLVESQADCRGGLGGTVRPGESRWEGQPTRSPAEVRREGQLTTAADDAASMGAKTGVRAEAAMGDVGGGAPENASPDSPTLTTTIDLTRGDDLDLVHRAVVSGWAVPQHVRNQIAEQLMPAIEAAARMNRAEPRRDWRIIKLVKLAVFMDARNRADEGLPVKGVLPRKRGLRPDRRLPRWMRRTQKAPAITETEIEVLARACRIFVRGLLPARAPSLRQ